MKRIDTDGRVVDGNGAGRDGFSNGNPVLGQEATIVDAAWLNAVQEEIARAVEASGQTLDAGNYDQLAASIPELARTMVSGLALGGCQVFTASNGAWSPPEGTYKIVWELLGGGGGGGGALNGAARAASGGSGGCYGMWIDTAPAASYAVVVGAGGAGGGNDGSNGSQGGASTVTPAGGSTVSVNGGTGGQGQNTGSPPKIVSGAAPRANAGSGLTYGRVAGPGGDGIALDATHYCSGNGGQSAMGGGGGQGVGTNSGDYYDNGNDASANSGGGGSGACTSTLGARYGGSGGSGFVRAWIYQH